MINRNSLLSRLPFLMKPSGRELLWGGSRLNDNFDKRIDMNPLAETWECSTHPDGPSTVASGAYYGKLLNEVLEKHPEMLGSHPKTKGELPILIKLIDAKQKLSVQVHPDDHYAREYENGSLGKTEMWYVLDAAKDAQLIYGLYRDTDKEELRSSLKQGTVEKYLQKVKIKKGDVFYIEAGTIHAIGAGALIAEIQENSNITYRLYDYDRVDKNGKKRELHVERALEVANLKGSAEPVQPMRVLKYRRGWATEMLCRCKYFQVERAILNTERCREMVSFQTGSTSFEVLLCVDGCGVLFYTHGQKMNEEENDFHEKSIRFFNGDCIFIPADSVPIKIHGRAQLLKVRC